MLKLKKKNLKKKEKKKKKRLQRKSFGGEGESPAGGTGPEDCNRIHGLYDF